ncbi:hypothetical protein CUMW_040000 [Citrus unshiu]|nr:hypothetical protein CUMW_040000 [Citrus unshiu]
MELGVVPVNCEPSLLPLLGIYNYCASDVFVFHWSFGCQHMPYGWHTCRAMQSKKYTQCGFDGKNDKTDSRSHEKANSMNLQYPPVHQWPYTPQQVTNWDSSSWWCARSTTTAPLHITLAQEDMAMSLQCLHQCLVACHLPDSPFKEELSDQWANSLRSINNFGKLNGRACCSSSWGLLLTGQPAKRGRPRKSAVLVDVLPTPNESCLRAQGRKPAATCKVQSSEARTLTFEKVILNKVEDKEKACHSLAITQQPENDEKISNLITKNCGNLEVIETI